MSEEKFLKKGHPMKYVSLSLLALVTASCIHAADPTSDAEKERIAQIITESRKKHAGKATTPNEEWEHFNQIFDQYRIRETEEEHRERLLKENPMMVKSEEINKAFMQSEVKKYAKTEMEDRIKRERELFDAAGLRIRTEVMRYFNITIKRTFREDSNDALALLAIEGIKEYERTQAWGLSVGYHWQDNEDGTRSLTCSVDVNPKELMALYDEVPGNN